MSDVEADRGPAIDFVLSAPSGAGKTTLAGALLERMEKLRRSISCTTRAPREGEVDGRDYFFVDAREFERRRRDGEFLEWAEVHGNLYGTLYSELDRIHADGCDALLVIDVQGAAAVRQALDEAVTIFVLPPSRKVLEARLERREGRDSECSARLRRRLDVADDEIARYVGYDYVLINDDFEEAVEELASVVRAERCRRDRRTALAERILESFRD